MKALVGAFNQEKALVGAFSVITNLRMNLFKALVKSGEKDADILEHYGDVLFQIGKKEEALLFWEKAIKAGSTSALIKEKIDEKKYME